MPGWKKTIFVNAIKTRMLQENRKADDIMSEYTKLTDAEKVEILSAINE